MARNYWLRLIDPETGRSVSDSILELRRDSDVCRVAMKLATPKRAAEVWQGDRLVCRIAGGANRVPWSIGPVY